MTDPQEKPKLCLYLRDRGDELQEALNDLGELATVHDFDPSSGAAMVTIGDEGLATMRARHPTLVVEPDSNTRPSEA